MATDNNKTVNHGSSQKPQQDTLIDEEFGLEQQAPGCNTKKTSDDNSYWTYHSAAQPYDWTG